MFHRVHTGKACEEHTACEGKAFEESERERETIKAKGFEEHRAFEGKAFEEMEIIVTGCKPAPANILRVQ
jgi:hypothetical protein